MCRIKIFASIVVTVAGNFLAGATEIVFSARIDQSSFAIPGYYIGSTLTGSFQYTAEAAPDEVGPNYTNYIISSMNHSIGSDNYSAATTRLSIIHKFGAHLYWPKPFLNIDAYEITGFGLTGPMIFGRNPLTCSLYLIDADASVYASAPPPYSVALPDLDQFEHKLFAVIFEDSARILCTINSISEVPDSGGLSLFLSAGLLAIVYRRRAFENCPRF